MTGLKTNAERIPETDRVRPEYEDVNRVVGGHLRIMQTQAPQGEFAGLCALCNLSASCTFVRSKDRPVLSCEEFDGSSSNVRLHVVRPPVRPVPTMRAAVSETVADTSVWGLCKTCTKRNECTFARPDGGVWQCEEFE